MSGGELDYRKVREFWNARAKKAGRIDPRSITFFCEDPEALEFRDRREKALFDEKVPLQGTECLLEVGCGSGRWTAFLASRCGRLVAFDVAEDLVEVGRQEASGAGCMNVDFRVADAMQLDLPEKGFDGAVCFGVSLYIRDENLVTFYGNLRRHLKPGGVLLTKEPLASVERIEHLDEYHEKLHARYSCIYRSRGDLEGAIEAAGFQKVWSFPVYGKDEPLAPKGEGIETWFGKWVLPEA
ncbi:MAG: class I SAM-dependent methyltransferase [Planctomycetota bacterium]|jgi:SAM-dependent methyltransferase